MSDKKPMQADGSGSKPEGKEPELASRPGGAGESGGGAYPNPHTGKGDKGEKMDTFLGHGGQSVVTQKGV